MAAGNQSITGPGSLKAHAAAHGLLTGAAVEAQLLATNPPVEKIVIDQYSILVAENSMKVGPMRPTPTTYSFEAGDALVAFGDAHGIKVRGHNLCWHSQLPSWFNSYATPENAHQLLVDHITTVVSHYKGKLHSWDVVNEAVQVSDGRPDGLRNGPWLKLLGPEFIPLAFRTARAADPNVLLTYNDYGLETDSPDDTKKRAAVLELVRGMKANHVPIDAVGIQSHIHAGWSRADSAGLREFMRNLREMGLKIFVTEMDVNDNNLTTQDPAEIDKAVAQTYREYLGVMMEEPAVSTIITWGVTDAHTWLAGRRPPMGQFPRPRQGGQAGQPGAPGQQAAQTEPGPQPNQPAVAPRGQQPALSGPEAAQGPAPQPSQRPRPPERPLPFDANNQPTEAFFAIRESFDKRSV